MAKMVMSPAWTQNERSQLQALILIDYNRVKELGFSGNRDEREAELGRLEELILAARGFESTYLEALRHKFGDYINRPAKAKTKTA